MSGGLSSPIFAQPTHVQHPDFNMALELQDKPASPNGYFSPLKVEVVADDIPADDAEPDSSLSRCPLHHVCEFATSLEDLKAALALAMRTRGAEALMERDQDGELPLHRACANTSAAAGAIVRTILEAAPQAVRVRGERGALPLHCIAELSGSLEALVVVAQSYPEALWQRDSVGDLPIHHACSNSTCNALAMVHALACGAPTSIQERGNGGRFPLHIAALESPCLGMVEFLIAQYPEALLEEEEDAYLPLHCACANTTEAAGEIVAAVAREAPEAARARDNEGLVPAAVCAHDTEVPRKDAMEAVLRVWPDAVWALRVAGDGSELCHETVRPVVAMVRDTLLTVAGGGWNAKLHYPWMHDSFKNSVLLLLMAQRRAAPVAKEGGIRIVLLPREVLLCIIKWAAALWVELPSSSQMVTDR